MAKAVEIVGIFVTAGNREDAGAQNADQAVPDTRRVARVGVARAIGSAGLASTTESYAKSAAYATSANLASAPS